MAESAHPLSDDEEDPNVVESAWAEEIRRRRQELDDGTVQPWSKDEFLRGLREAK